MRLYQTVISMLAVMVLLIVGLAVHGIIERHKWQVFKAAHECKPAKQVARETGWLCNDGQTYWRREP